MSSDYKLGGFCFFVDSNTVAITLGKGRAIRINVETREIEEYGSSFAFAPRMELDIFDVAEIILEYRREIDDN